MRAVGMIADLGRSKTASSPSAGRVRVGFQGYKRVRRFAD
jgi:hypothetical protein